MSYLEDLAAKRRAVATEAAAKEAREKEAAKRRRLIFWLAIMPFALFALASLYSGAQFNGYAKGWQAGRAGKGFVEGLESP